MQQLIKGNALVRETWHLLPAYACLDGLSKCYDLI
ncbi:MAG: oxidoreductase, partial [Halopseudomonas sp.]